LSCLTHIQEPEMSAITRRHIDGRLPDAADSSAGGLRASAGTQPNDRETGNHSDPGQTELHHSGSFRVEERSCRAAALKKKPATGPIAAAATGAVAGEGLAVACRQVGPVAGVIRAEGHCLRGRLG